MVEPRPGAAGAHLAVTVDAAATDSPLRNTLVRRMAHASGDVAHLVAERGGTAISLRVAVPARARVAHALGLESLPSNNTTAATRSGHCLWMRPDEWLVVGAEGVRKAIVDTLEAAVGSDDGAVVDVSASRIVLELSGSASRDVLANCCPLDLHPRVFKTGHCAQSLIAKAPMMLHLLDDAPRWHLYVRPSLAEYVVAWLTDAMLCAHAMQPPRPTLPNGVGG